MSTCTHFIPGAAVGLMIREEPAAYGVQYGTTLAEIDRDVLAAIRAVMLAGARIIEGQAALISRIYETKAHEKLGFHFEDLAREVFLMNPRTARNRLALHRTLSARPMVREAFQSGEVTACQVLVIEKVLSPENEEFWIAECRNSTVSQLVLKIRLDRQAGALAQAVLAEPAADHADMRSVSFEIPPFARVAWNDGMKLARKVLGYEAPTYQCIDAVLAEAAAGECPKEALPPAGKRGRLASETTALTAPAGRPSNRVRSNGTSVRRVPVKAFQAARDTLDHVEQLLRDLDDLLDTSPAVTPRGLVDRVRAIQAHLGVRDDPTGSRHEVLDRDRPGQRSGEPKGSRARRLSLSGAGLQPTRSARESSSQVPIPRRRRLARESSLDLPRPSRAHGAPWNHPDPGNGA